MTALSGHVRIAGEIRRRFAQTRIVGCIPLEHQRISMASGYLLQKLDDVMRDLRMVESSSIFLQRMIDPEQITSPLRIWPQPLQYPNLKQNTANFKLNYGLPHDLEVDVDSPYLSIYRSARNRPSNGVGDTNLGLEENFRKVQCRTLYLDQTHKRLRATGLTAIRPSV